jgi:hypothetical protein
MEMCSSIPVAAAAAATGLSVTIVIAVAAALAGAGGAIAYLRRGRRRTLPVTKSDAPRILFPFLGGSISKRTLEAALRLSRADHATLVPAYIASVPRALPLDARLSAECAVALPLLETIEQLAARSEVGVDSRIETGRTARHALTRLMDEEQYDRLVVSAATETSEGFAPEDVAWLLDHSNSEVVIIKPSNGDSLAVRSDGLKPS